MSPVPTLFGKRLRERREARGWEQTDLARASGVSASVISRLESGERQDVKARIARKLARALGIGVDYLLNTFGEEGEETPGQGWLGVRHCPESCPLLLVR